MTETVNLMCPCGALQGTLKVVPKAAFHVHCLCCDCQNFASYLNNTANILDEYGGSELFQTYPAFMEIAEGQEKIGCMQFGSTGLYRWHTTCCNMPIANTMNSSKVPFIGVSVKLMQFSDQQEKLKMLGPLAMKAFGKYAIGEMPKDAYSRFPLSYMPRILAFMLRGMLGKKSNPSPFFKGGEPVAKAKVLSLPG